MIYICNTMYYTVYYTHLMYVCWVRLHISPTARQTNSYAILQALTLTKYT